MTWLVAIVILIAFLVLVQLMKVPALAAQVMASSKSALGDLRNPGLTDLEKERAMRSHSGRMFGLFFRVTGATLLALGAPFGAAWLLDRAGVVPLAGVLDVMTSWAFLGAATAIGFLFFSVIRSGWGRRRPSTP